MITAPPVRRRLVGGALRRCRENLGYTLDDAARFLKCDRSKISRIETGQRGIHSRELRELLAAYGVTNKWQALLSELADPCGAFGWCRDYADVLPGAWQEYLILEAGASRITIYEAQRIPALLHTRAYARELAEADPGLADDDARTRAVEAMLARQKAIFGDHKPDIQVVIGEAALRQEIGGPEVMSGQLALLSGVSGDSGMVTVQILPFTSGAHAAVGVGSLALVQFAEAPGLGIVHVGGVTGGVCLERQEDLAAHARVFEQLRAYSLSPADSALYLRRLTSD